MIFRATLFGWGLTLLLTGAIVLGSLSMISAPSSAHSRNENKPLLEPPKKSFHTSFGVTKDFWTSEKEGKRFHHRIETPRSTLELTSNGRRLELIEEMEGIRSIFQESSLDDISALRFIESERGTFNYRHFTFTAPKVQLTLCNALSLQNFLPFNHSDLKGVAEKVTLSFLNGSPRFQAKTFRATISPREEEGLK